MRDGGSPSTPPESHRQPAELAVDDVAVDLEFHSREAVFARLTLVNGALERIREGSYGLCGECGRPISARRLASDAAVALCVECQSSHENSRHPSTM